MKPHTLPNVLLLELRMASGSAVIAMTKIAIPTGKIIKTPASPSPGVPKTSKNMRKSVKTIPNPRAFKRSNLVECLLAPI